MCMCKIQQSPLNIKNQVLYCVLCQSQILVTTFSQVELVHIYLKNITLGDCLEIGLGTTRPADLFFSTILCGSQ